MFNAKLTAQEIAKNNRIQRVMYHQPAKGVSVLVRLPSGFEIAGTVNGLDSLADYQEKGCKILACRLTA